MAHQSSLPAKAGDEPAQERGSHDGPEAKASTPPSVNVVDLTGDDGGEGKEEEGKGEGGTEATNQPEGKHHACLTSVIPQELSLSKCGGHGLRVTCVCYDGGAVAQPPAAAPKIQDQYCPVFRRLCGPGDEQLDPKVRGHSLSLSIFCPTFF